MLREADAGVKTSEICRKRNVSDATLYTWKAKYARMGISDLRKMRGVGGCRRLKQIVDDQTSDNQALKALTSKNYLNPK